MTLKYFRKLSESKQYCHILIKGVCIGERSTPQAQFLLFQIDRFYVEVAFDKITDEVLHAYHFEGIDELKPYLEDLDLTELL